MRHARRAAEGDFGLHERLARARNRTVRLNRAGAAFLLVAVLSWLGLPLGPWRVPLSFLAGLVALAWPVHGSRSWALGVIRRQTGLAYETALALEEQPRDEYGFRPLIRARARSRIAGLELPHQAEWWLAAFAVALVLLFLPALPARVPWGGGAPPPAAQGPAPTQGAADEEEHAQEQPPSPAEELEENLPARAAAPESPAPAGASAPAEARDAREQEAEVLDRFLDNLRERREPQQAAAELPLSEVPGAAEGTSTAEAPEEPGGTAPAENGDTETPGPAADGQAGADDGNGTVDGSAAGEAPGEQPAADAGAEANESAAGDGRDQDGAGDTPGPGDALSAGTDGSDSAGAGAGPEGSTAGERLPDTGAREEELLEGTLLSDRFNLGGDVRLPGFTDVELPPGASPSGYGRAVERSLSGGTVPLEYQEVIRGYFR